MDWQPTCWTAVELTMTTAIIFDPQRSSCFCHLDPRHCWKFPCCHVLASVDIMSERRLRNIPLPSVMNNHQLASHPPRLNCPLIFHEPVCVCVSHWFANGHDCIMHTSRFSWFFFPACHTHTANPTGAMCRRCAPLLAGNLPDPKRELSLVRFYVASNLPSDWWTWSIDHFEGFPLILGPPLNCILNMILKLCIEVWIPHIISQNKCAHVHVIWGFPEIGVPPNHQCSWDFP